MTPPTSSPSVTTLGEYENYIMDSNNQIVDMRKSGRFNQSIILKHEDGTEWIFLNNKQKERFWVFYFCKML